MTAPIDTQTPPAKPSRRDFLRVSALGLAVPVVAAACSTSAVTAGSVRYRIRYFQSRLDQTRQYGGLNLNQINSVDQNFELTAPVVVFPDQRDLGSAYRVAYDLLARRWVPYGYIYPFAEFTAGALMAAHALDWLSIPLALFIGTIGAVSVFYAVYVQKRELKCACVGGSSRVPLGFVSLTENLMMIAMAVWMALP